MEVGENAEFRTGPRSAVRFVIPPDQTITLDRLGTVKVLQAINDNGVIQTQMGMKYGRTRYDIEAAGREHESTIASPSSTLAVRGTEFSVVRPASVPRAGRQPDRPRRSSATSRSASNFGGRGAGKTKIDVNNPNAASVALGEAVVDPSIKLARTEAEDQLVATLLSQRRDGRVRLRQGHPRRPRRPAAADRRRARSRRCPARSTSSSAGAAGTDLNLGVFTAGRATPQGESIYPVGGVEHHAERRRDPVRPSRRAERRHRGRLLARQLPASSPTRFGSVHISGPNAPATIDVFRNGQRVHLHRPGRAADADRQLHRRPDRSRHRRRPVRGHGRSSRRRRRRDRPGGAAKSRRPRRGAVGRRAERR